MNNSLSTQVHEWTEEREQKVRELICPGLNKTDAELFIQFAKARRLDPLQRQIYAIMRSTKKGDKWVEQMTIQTGIDGFRAIAARTGQYAGMDDIEIEWDTKPEHQGFPLWAKCTVYRFVQGQRCPFSARVWFSERAQFKGHGADRGLNSMWRDQPISQLEKCAEAAALRRGFPEDLGQIYLAEEFPEPGSLMSEAPKTKWEQMKAANATQKPQDAPNEQMRDVTPPADDDASETEANAVADLAAKAQTGTDLFPLVARANAIANPKLRRRARTAVQAKALALNLVWDDLLGFQPASI